MQDIKKQCDRCNARDSIKKTIDNPSPISKIKTVKVTGLGKTLSLINMDLCENCHTTLFSIISHWIQQTKPLTDFFDTKETPAK